MDLIKKLVTELMELLKAFLASKEVAPVIPLPVAPPPPIAKQMVEISKVPEFGDKGEHVKALQKALGVKDDGDFGPITKKAVSEVQKKNGLAGSGVIGPKTLDILGLKVVATNPATGGKTITRDLEGKQERRLHPELRVLLEQKVFPGGNIPNFWHQKELAKVAIALGEALLSMKIREVGGNNKGYLVSLLQDVIGIFKTGGTGDAWCKSAMQVIIAFIEDFYGVESPVLASEHCMTVNNAAKKVPGLWTEACEVGTMFEFQNGTSQSGHTGLVKSKTATTMITLEGNTGDSSLSDGDGFFEKVRNQKKNGSFNTRGFVRIYPNNKVP